MAANTTTQFVLSAAADAYSTLNRAKGQRPAAVTAFLADPETAVDEFGAGFVRRGLREAAVFFEGHDDQETANAFWTLRDSVDNDGLVDFDDTAVEDEA
jgi:hypothetical protein